MAGGAIDVTDKYGTFGLSLAGRRKYVKGLGTLMHVLLDNDAWANWVEDTRALLAISLLLSIARIKASTEG